MGSERFEIWQLDAGGRPTVRVAAFATRREAERFVASSRGRLILRDTGETLVHAGPPSSGRPRVIERDDTTRPDPRRPSRAPTPPSRPALRSEPRVTLRSEPRITPAPMRSEPRVTTRSEPRITPAPMRSEPAMTPAPRSPRVTPAPRSAPRITPPPTSHTRTTAPEPVVATPKVDELEKRHQIRHLMARGRYEEATQAMDEAALSGDEIALYRVWIDCERALVDDADPGLDPVLAPLAATALRENRKLGFGYYVLGRIAEAEGRTDDARRAFRIATELSPDHRDARRRDHLLRRRGNGR